MNAQDLHNDCIIFDGLVVANWERAIFQDMAKATREKIRLVSSAGTGYFYTTTKNRRLQPEKLTTKKYDPKARKHVEFTEQKMK